MIELKGTISPLIRKGFIKKEDLLEYDGPILSLFEKEENSFLCLWVDCSKEANRWMFFDVSKENLSNYLSGDDQLQVLIKSALNVYFIDIFDEENFDEYFKNAILVKYSDIPFSYIPQNAFYFV